MDSVPTLSFRQFKKEKSMELKIYSPQEAGFIQKIDWNFEELKEEKII